MNWMKPFHIIQYQIHASIHELNPPLEFVKSRPWQCEVIFTKGKLKKQDFINATTKYRITIY